MIKKITALSLILSLICLCFSFSASAAMDSSDYISSYSAYLSQGSTSGKIEVHYSVVATGTMSTIGAYTIEVYTSNHTKIQTINGSTSNGLLIQNRIGVSDTYTLSLTSGTVYYCKVTLYAAKNGGSDSRTVTTGTITAP